ncbi:MAG TPA: type 4a pilus biogenesis protein PilO [Thermoanaerobaculia bacterium]|nr:type 4a pilus biogenesis protein PilO [Thermoanaerobaculia bacterium]
MAIDSSSLQDKPWYLALGLGLFLAILVVFGLYWFAIKGWDEESVRLTKRLDELQKDIQAGRSAQQRLPQLRDEARRLELELEKLRRILPSSRNTEELIKKFKSLVDQGDFTLERLVFPRLTEAKSSSPDEVYVEWPISVALQGRYHDLAVLFSRLANFSRIVNVEQFTITALPVQLDRTIRAEFVAKTFVYREPSDEKAAAPKGKKAKKGKPGGKAGGEEVKSEEPN